MEAVDRSAAVNPAVPVLPVHVKAEEKISAVISRDGGLESCEVSIFMAFFGFRSSFGLRFPYSSNFISTDFNCRC